MPFDRVTLFRFFGFRVMADASWLFLSVLIAWTAAVKIFPLTFAGQEPQIYQIMGVAALVGVIASILMHEVAHAIVAEYYDMKIDNITLFIFGGVAEMKGEPSHPKGEFLMAMAGPVMSALLALAFMAAMNLCAAVCEGAVTAVLDFLARLNMLIALLNVIPAYPLDGGRALRAAIWHLKDNYVQATRIASGFGALVGYLLMAWALYECVVKDKYLTALWTGLFGYFMLVAGRYAVRETESRTLLGTETVDRFVRAAHQQVSPGLTIEELAAAYLNHGFQRSFPVVDREKLVGVVTLQAVLALDRNKWPWLHVASVMEPLSAQNFVYMGSSAADALDSMQRSGRDHLMVADDTGRLAGVIIYRDLVELVSITMKIDSGLPVARSRRGR